ncbi:phage protein Gp27 family protein [uncultured Maricaulis sp.]|uniref:phage protein Gp27 family protein n=1 Tax=uncultured Maricaulis sp. TaxID=174710 RepID=UPI0030D7E9EA|tara:strand:- start:141912 stop:142523 length:612 start_codon:yes stop_codon:yes gene_type:complete
MSRRSNAKRQRREGRGRLSTLDLLPEEADGDILWLNEELREGRRLQIDLLDEFNARLADKGIGSISKSAFSRYTVRKATQFRQLDETRRISVELADMLGVDSSDKMTIALSEMLKMAAFRIAEGGNLNTKDVMELARATQSLTSAQKASADHRRALQDEMGKRVREGLEKVEGGLEGDDQSVPDGREVLRRIRQEVYGIFDAA